MVYQCTTKRFRRVVNTLKFGREAGVDIHNIFDEANELSTQVKRSSCINRELLNWLDQTGAFLAMCGLIEGEG